MLGGNRLTHCLRGVGVVELARLSFTEREAIRVSGFRTKNVEVPRLGQAMVGAEGGRGEQRFDLRTRHRAAGEAFDGTALFNGLRDMHGINLYRWRRWLVGRMDTRRAEQWRSDGTASAEAGNTQRLTSSQTHAGGAVRLCVATIYIGTWNR
jgi:hypothetical protein